MRQTLDMAFIRQTWGFADMPDSLTPENVVSVTGFVIEAGHINMGRKRGDSEAMGVVLECGTRNIRITGLDRDESVALARCLGEEVTLRITEVRKP